MTKHETLIMLMRLNSEILKIEKMVDELGQACALIARKAA